MKIVVLDAYTLNPGERRWEELEELGEVIVHDPTGCGTSGRGCRCGTD